MTFQSTIASKAPRTGFLNGVLLRFYLKPAIVLLRFLFLIAILFSGYRGVSQTPSCGSIYQQNKFIAYRYSAQGKPDSALIYYKRAFATGAAAVNDMLMAADKAVLADSLTIARAFILQAFGRGLSQSGYRQFLKWSSRDKVDKENWISGDTIALLIGQYQQGLNQPLIAELKEMEENDQLGRDDDSDLSTALTAYQDSVNAERLKKMVAALGHLPGYSEVGSDGTDVLELLFLHMNAENLGWFMPYIIDQVHKCEYFDVDGLAYQIDRIAVGSGLALYIDEHNMLKYDMTMPVFLNRQYYSVTGYWYDRSPRDEKEYFWPVFEPFRAKQLNATRERLCLDPYEHYLSRRPRTESAPAETLIKMFGR